MRPDYHICDICGGKAEPSPLFITTGFHLDAAGSNAETGYEVDICGKCARKLLATLLAKNILDSVALADYLKNVRNIKMRFYGQEEI